MYCPAGNATDPIWRALASSDRISSWTPLKPQHSNPNSNPLANQLWCIDFLTPPTPLIIPHRLPDREIFFFSILHSYQLLCSHKFRILHISNRKYYIQDESSQNQNKCPKRRWYICCYTISRWNKLKQTLEKITTNFQIYHQQKIIFFLYLLTNSDN